MTAPDAGSGAGGRATPTLPTPLLGRLRDAVLERGYLRAAEPFRLSSGGFSRDYIDMRRALAQGADLRLAAEAVLERLTARGFAVDAAGGLTMGADPIAHAVAVVAGCEWFSVRKEAKSHGAGRRVEGAELGPGRRVLLLEDTASTGRSSLEALEVVAETGAEVVLALAVLDRAGVAAAALAARGVAFDALLTWTDLGIERLSVEPFGLGPGSSGPGSAGPGDVTGSG